MGTTKISIAAETIVEAGETIVCFARIAVEEMETDSAEAETIAVLAAWTTATRPWTIVSATTVSAAEVATIDCCRARNAAVATTEVTGKT